MKTKILALTAFLSLMAISLNATSAKPTNPDNKQQTEIRYDGMEFNRIEAGTAVEIILVPAHRSHIEIKGSSEDIRNTYTDLRGQKLVIYVRNPEGKTISDYKGKIVVHYSGSISEIEANSAARITNSNHTLKAHSLSIEASSAAMVDLEIACENLEIDVSSAATIHLGGSALHAEIDASSAANANLENIKIEYAEIDASSAANIRINASNMNIEASTGSSIRYSGNPVIHRMETSTGGSIKAI